MNILEPVYKWARQPSKRYSTTEIILHHVGVDGSFSPESIHNSHLANGWCGIAYHFYVRRNGEVHRGRPIDTQGGHTLDFNWCSIGVCFEGNFENETMCIEQINSGIALISYLRGLYPTARINKHSFYNPTACPGKNFLFDGIVNPNNIEPSESCEVINQAPPTWAEESCAKVVKAGIIKGNDKGEYNWDEPVTRQEIAVMFDRLKLVGTKIML